MLRIRSLCEWHWSVDLADPTWAVMIVSVAAYSQVSTVRIVASLTVAAPTIADKAQLSLELNVS
eukprot:scaffold229373_cov25-Cyclotella_meneghiniana.AAC.1